MGLNVQAFSTTRFGGVSHAPYGLHDGQSGGLNLATHVGDALDRVVENRRRLAELLPSEPHWMQQVHGITVHEVISSDHAEAVADAAITTRAEVVLAILTADCLPVLLADRHGKIVGAAHAGWRGLAGGVLECVVRAMRDRVPQADLCAWIGPAIGARAYEVGDAVREALIAGDALHEEAFSRSHLPGKWFVNLAMIAQMRLQRHGVGLIECSEACTASDFERFWSYRRDGISGRIATCIWLQRGLSSI